MNETHIIPKAMPWEILREIAYMRRDVFLAMSSTCKLLRGALSPFKAENERRFIRRYITMCYDTLHIRDRWWLSCDHVGITITIFTHDKVIEFLYPDNTTRVIQYSWNSHDNTHCGQMRKITTYAPIGINPYQRPISETLEPITPCNTFEAVVNDVCDLDIVIYDYYPVKLNSR